MVTSPYTHTIGVGKGQLGLFLTDQNVKKHKLSGYHMPWFISNTSTMGCPWS